MTRLCYDDAVVAVVSAQRRQRQRVLIIFTFNVYVCDDDDRHRWPYDCWRRSYFARLCLCVCLLCMHASNVIFIPFGNCLFELCAAFDSLVENASWHNCNHHLHSSRGFSHLLRCFKQMLLILYLREYFLISSTK